VTTTVAEQVLVVPTAIFHEIGLFQGFCGDVERYLPRLLDARHLSYRPRSEVETDPSYKQLVPYAVLRCGDQLFHYTRGQCGSEARLRALRSIGVGGHVNESDGPASGDAYRAALKRELTEEVIVETTYREYCIGLINDDSSAVGQVHLGIVHIYDLQKPLVRRRESVLARAGFAALGELRGQREEFETWSQFVLDTLG
jgi:predicted NUDIX family phosphoesterase